jgi:integrase
MAPETEIWDSAVTGFGARRQRSEAVTYTLLYRTAAGRSRRFTIGRHGAPWTPETARDEARRLLGLVAQGQDPAADKRALRSAVTVAELCARYLEDAKAGRIIGRGGLPKKPSTLASDEGRVHGHIVPLLGRLAVAAITRQDIEQAMHDIAAGKTETGPRKVRPRGISKFTGGRGVATRTVGLLGAIFSYAMDRGLRPDNPAHRVRKLAENRRDRRLSDAEYRALGEGLRAAAVPHLPPGAKINVKPAAMWPPAIAAIRFLALTGWRMGEALDLTWQDVDLARRTVTLSDSKTGPSVRPLSHVACAVLRDLPQRMGTDRAVPASRGDGPMVGLKKFFRRVAALGDLPGDITPHTLRHSFASLAADLGFGDAAIAAMIGHRRQGMTARYTHAADAVVLAAADAVADETARRMGDAKPAGAVVPLRAG